MLENNRSPFGIAVTDEHIYWTDTRNNSVHRMLKSARNQDYQMELFSGFSDVGQLMVVRKNELAKKGEKLWN